LARFTALLDACTVVPIVRADTLLRIAEREMYCPKWSDRIIEEARRAIEKIHPGISTEKIAKRFNDMNKVFDEALVNGWESLVPTIELPDPDDRHVVAAAILGGAQLIITDNIKDFPADALEPFGIEAVTADDFLLDQLDLNRRIVLNVIEEQAKFTSNPHLEPQDLIARLEQAGVPRFADEVRRTL
jgi:predicted nucleic acid-binding protein